MADKVGDAARWVGTRLWDGVTGLVSGVLDAVEGALRNVVEGVGTFFGGIGKLLSGDFGGAFAAFGKALGEIFLQTPADAILMVGGRVLSAVQTLVGLEPPGRQLTGEEIAALREVYGDRIDYAAVRLKEGNVGLFGAPGRPFTHGNTIYVPEGWLKDHLDPAVRRQLLVHEMAHVWQHQNGGTDYMSEALGAQWFGDGYNFAKGLVEGKGWAELNPEQQAELLERAFEAGYIGANDPARRFLVELTDPARDYGFRVVVASEGSPEYATAIADGYGDHTATLEDALRQVREGKGAP